MREDISYHGQDTYILFQGQVRGRYPKGFTDNGRDNSNVKFYLSHLRLRFILWDNRGWRLSQNHSSLLCGRW